MTDKTVTSIDKFKLMVLSPEFTDNQVYEALMSFELSDGEEEIHQIIGVLSKHRNSVLKRLEVEYPKLKEMASTDKSAP